MIKPFSTRPLTSLSDLALLILRLSAGGFMLTHGYPKLQRLLGDGPISFGDPLGIGEASSLVLVVFAEFLCAILVMIGLATRLASIPLIIAMIVAAFIAHAGDPFGDKEMALLYLLLFVLIFVFGPGRFSVDRLIKG